MATYDLNVADLDELLELLHAEIDYVGFDPATLNLPGLWVNVTGFAITTMCALAVKLELIALAPNADPRVALEVVQPTFNSVMAVLKPLGGPTGDPVTGVWQISPPSGPRLPGVAIPFDLLTHQEPS